MLLKNSITLKLMKKWFVLCLCLLGINMPTIYGASLGTDIVQRIDAIELHAQEKRNRAQVIAAFLADNPLPPGASEEDRLRYRDYNFRKRTFEVQARNLDGLVAQLRPATESNLLTPGYIRRFDAALSEIESDLREGLLGEVELIPASAPAREPASEPAEPEAILEAVEEQLTAEKTRRSDRKRRREARRAAAEAARLELEAGGPSEEPTEEVVEPEVEPEVRIQIGPDADAVALADVELGADRARIAAEEARRQREAAEALADVEYQADLARIAAEEERRQRAAAAELADTELQADRAREEAEEERRQRELSEQFGDIEYEIEERNRALAEAAEEERRLAERTEELAQRQAMETLADVEYQADVAAGRVPGPQAEEREPEGEERTEEPEDSPEEAEEETETGTLASGGPIQYVELTCRTALNVRRTSSVSSDRIEDLSCRDYNGRQTKVLILGEENGFYKVFVNGELGWISGEHTSAPRDVGSEDDSRTSFYEPQTGRLNCRSRLNRRSGPSTRYRVVGKIPCRSGGQGTPVTILGRHEDTGWYIAEYNGERTWVSNRYVDVPNPNALRTLTDEIIQGLDQIPGLGGTGIDCTPGSTPQSGDCVNFNQSFYTREDSGRQIAASINQAKQRGTNAKKQRFFELFSPIALEIQKHTGWPASVTLAQIAIETAWGTSNVLQRLNNFGGHSCWDYNPNGSRALRNPNLASLATQPGRQLPGYFTSSGGTPRIRAACTYPRPRREGHYYRTFNNIIEGALLYADNVLENDAYRSAQNHVKSRFAAGQKADPGTVVRGLRAYAADAGYRDSLMSTIRANNLTRFDDMTTCD